MSFRGIAVRLGLPGFEPSKAEIAYENVKRLIDYEQENSRRYKALATFYSADTTAKKRDCEKRKILARAMLKKGDAAAAHHYRKLAKKADERAVFYETRVNQLRELVFNAESRRDDFKALRAELKDRMHELPPIMPRAEQQAAGNAIIEYLGEKEMHFDRSLEEMDEVAEEIRKYLTARLPTEQDYLTDHILEEEAVLLEDDGNSEDWKKWEKEFEQEAAALRATRTEEEDPADMAA